MGLKKKLWRYLHIGTLWLRTRAPWQVRVVLGAGGTYLDGWLHTDINTLNVLAEADWRRYFQPNSLQALLAEHVWEHLTLTEAKLALRLAFRYLRPGGYIRIAVPDGNHTDPNYIDYVRPEGMGFGAKDHKVLYTYQSISQLLLGAGFQVELLEFFDEYGRFQAKEWDTESGMIERSIRFDSRNTDGLPHYTSLIVDGVKPAA